MPRVILMISMYMLNRFLSLVCLLFLSINTVETGAKTNLKIVTINIRYDTDKDGDNKWENRRVYFVDYVNSLDADIICMQEVLNRQLTDLSSAMPQYEYVGTGGRDGKLKGEFCPVFYNKKKFKLIDSGHFWLSETPDSIGSIGWDSKSPHIVTWIQLKTSDNQSFYVVNTHFDWAGNRARQQSAKLVLKWIKENVEDAPIILAGDFNIGPGSYTYKTMVDSGIVNDSYLIASQRRGVAYSYHDFGKLPNEKRKRLDYVFVGNDINVSEVEIVRENDENGCFLSDHNPVIAYITLK